MPVGKNKNTKYDTIVAKSPSLLLCKHTMSLTEKKLFDLALVALKNDYEAPGGILKVPEGKQLEVSIPARLIKKQLGFTSNNIYTKLYNIADNYSKIRFALKKDPSSSDVSDGAFEFMTPFPYCRYEDGSFTMRFESGLNKEIANLDSGNYALSDTAYTSKFTKKAASDLFDIVSWYRWRGGFTISIEELRVMLGLDLEVKDENGEVKQVQKYGDFKRMNAFVLKPAMEEINALTDINISMTTKKTGNKVKYLDFKIEVKDTAIVAENGAAVMPRYTESEIDESITSSARILKLIIKDEDISENDVVLFLMEAGGDQEKVVEKWQLYSKKKLSGNIINPVGWIINAIRKDYPGGSLEDEVQEVVEAGRDDTADNTMTAEMEDALDNIADMLMEEQFRMKDVRAIAKSAGYDVGKVIKAYTVLKGRKNTTDRVAFLIAAIKDDYEPSKGGTADRRKNAFNDFEQREYSENDYTELEKKKLRKL